MVDYLKTSLRFDTAQLLIQWQEDLLKTYPLPEAPSDKCRDAFLNDILADYQKTSEEQIIRTEPNVSEQSSIISANSWHKRLIHHMTIRKTFRAKRRDLTITDDRISRITAPDIFELMKGRFGRLTSAVGFLFTLMELANIKEALNVIRDTCSLKVPKDTCFNIFSWAKEDFFIRLNLPDSTYLDVINFNLKIHMNCYKFQMDIKETMRLFTAVEDDWRKNSDICENSMYLIKDAEIEIKELISTYLKMAEEEHRDIALTAIGFAGRSGDPGHLRQKSVQLRINKQDFEFPIEARYRINWANSQIDQISHKRQRHVERTSAKLNKVHQQTKENIYLWRCTQASYEGQIMSLRDRLKEVEKLYEMNMDFLSNEHDMIETKLMGVKEELVNNRARVEMFHQRIETLLQFLAQQK
ncbi:hypothetical protein KR093_011517, partial [Drosophila rubida]